MTPLMQDELRYRRRVRRLNAITSALIGLAAFLFVVFVFVEAAVGCGQVTHYADGTWATNECAFINHPVQTGRW